MIRWLINWFRRRRARKSRELFSFFDGVRMRKVDPFAIERGFSQHPEFRLELLDLVEAGEPDATAITLRAICDVFELKPWDDATETGLTQIELFKVFIDFDLYCESLKKKYKFGPTSQAPMAPTCSDLPTNSAPTNLPMDCTSTEAEATCAAPLQ